MSLYLSTQGLISHAASAFLSRGSLWILKPSFLPLWTPEAQGNEYHLGAASHQQGQVLGPHGPCASRGINPPCFLPWLPAASCTIQLQLPTESCLLGGHHSTPYSPLLFRVSFPLQINCLPMNPHMNGAKTNNH